MTKLLDKKYHWKPSRHNLNAIQAHKHGNFKLCTFDQIPDVIDLRAHASPVYDQGNIGSCTANALVSVVEYLEHQAGGTFTSLSRLFLYWQERFKEGDVADDNGAQICDGVSVLANLGCASESLDPYVVTAYTKAPTVAAVADAAQHRIAAYAQVQPDPGSVMQCLASGYPVVFGFTVYDSFESDTVAKTGIMPMPNTATENNLGGHAVAFYGYDKIKRLFLVRNSWGPDWGQGGYFWMPFDYIANPQLSSDYWVITK